MTCKNLNIYSWKNYNKSIVKIAKKNIQYNNNHHINSIEHSYYPHTRDMFSISITETKIKTILDYGSNISSLSNIINKIETKSKKFLIFDPFKFKNKIKIKKINYKIINDIKKIQKEKINFIHFGSCLQYIENFKYDLKKINYKKCLKILITATPITYGKAYKTEQSNHKNLIQNVHNIYDVISFFQSVGFKLIFKSAMNIDLAKLKKINKKTYFLNILLKKK